MTPVPHTTACARNYDHKVDCDCGADPPSPAELFDSAFNMQQDDADLVKHMNTLLDDPASIETLARTHSSMLVRQLAARLVPLESIKCVAMARRGRIHALPHPADHQVLLHYVHSELNMREQHPHVLGYLTTRGRFVNCAEALYVARQAGQLLTSASGRKNLYPTDLW